MINLTPTPALSWVLDKMAEKTAKPLTPRDAWGIKRTKLRAAIAAAETDPGLDWEPGKTASYEAARKVFAEAKSALKAFDRQNPQPHVEKTWKDVSREDPLLKVIFGDLK